MTSKLRAVPFVAEVPFGYTVSLGEGIFEGASLFEARVRELPDVVEYAATAADAHALAVDTIQTTAEEFAFRGRSMPSPVRSAPAL